MFYLSLFALASTIFFLAQSCEARSRTLFWTLAYAGVFVLAFVAGCRDDAIGTDIHVYARPTFETARWASSFWQGYERREGWVELVYYAINWVAASVSSRFGLALFLQNFIMTAFVMHGMAHYRRSAPLWMTMLAYELLFYNLTFNVMRQGLAMAIVLWSMRYFPRESRWHLMLCAIGCFFVHKSSVVAYSAILGIRWIVSMPVEKQKRLTFAFALAAVSCVALFPILLQGITGQIPALRQYAGYAKMAEENAGVLKRDLVFYAMILLMLWAVVHRRMAERRIAYVANLLILVYLASLGLGVHSPFAPRIGYYWLLASIPLLFSTVMRCDISRRSKFLVVTAILLYLCEDCAKKNFVWGLNETYPYASQFLGI